MSIAKSAFILTILTFGSMLVSATVSWAQAVSFSGPTNFAVGDFNGDGKQDLAAAYLRQPATLTLPFKPRML